MRVDQRDVTTYLLADPKPEVNAMAHDVALVAALVKTINASLDFATAKSPLDFALRGTKKVASISKIAETASGSQALKAGNFMVGEATKTMSLIGVAAKASSGLMSPARASGAITVAVAEKIVMAAGLGGFNKCRTALAQMSLTTAATAIAAPTGVGAVVGGLAMLADAMNVYGACYADGRNGRDLTF